MRLKLKVLNCLSYIMLTSFFCFFISYLFYNKVEQGIEVFREKYPRLFQDVWYQERFMVSTIHASVHIVVGTTYLMGGLSDTLYSYLIWLGSSGYYIKDTLFVYRNPLYSRKIKWQYMIHHLFCLSIYDKVQGYEWLFSRAFMIELTLPITNWCMYLRRTGQTETRMYFWSSIIAGILYFMVRIIYGAYITFYLAVLSGKPFFILCGVGLYSLSVFWMVKIIKKIKT